MTAVDGSETESVTYFNSAGAQVSCTENLRTEFHLRRFHLGIDQIKSRSIYIVLLVTLTLFLWPQRSMAEDTSDRLQINANSVRELIEKSRDQNGNISTIGRRIGLFIFDRQESDEYSEFLFFELQLLGRVVEFVYVTDKRYELSDDGSELVIARDFNEDKIKFLERYIPLARQTIEKNRASLSPGSCEFFSDEDPSHPGRIQTAYIFAGRDTAYIFAGRDNEDVGACLHRQFLRSFGIVDQRVSGLSFADNFIAQLIALRVADLCSVMSTVKRDDCLDSEITRLTIGR